MMGVLKDIAVFIDPEPVSVLSYRLAARLAERWQAHLTGVFSVPEISCNPWIRGKAIREALDKYLEVIKGVEQRTRDDFEKVCQRHGIVCEWRSQRIEPPEEMIVHACYSTLSVVARSDAEDAPLLGLPERLILRSGRPTLLLPPTTDPEGPLGKHMAIGWNASPEAARAVSDAMPFLITAEEVEVLIVDEERHRDTYGDAPGTDLARHLTRYGVEVNVRPLSSDDRDIGKVLLDLTGELSVDLLVLGAYSHARFAEAILGGVTRRVLRESCIPALMSR